MKEPRGRVRVLGLGPTPQDLGTPGTRGKVNTRVLVEMVARRDAEHRMSTMEEQMQQLQEQVNHMREIMLTSQGGHHLETPGSQHGSNSRQVICFPNHMYLSIALTIHHPFNKSVYILFGRTQEVNS